jgi:transposase
VAEKRAIVEETRRHGASVAQVAQRHGVNANQLFSWRRLYVKGALMVAADAPALLPVKVSTPTLLPSERTKELRLSEPPAKTLSGAVIEIEFAGGVRLRVRGRVDRSTLSRILAHLSRR